MEDVPSIAMWRSLTAREHHEACQALSLGSSVECSCPILDGISPIELGEGLMIEENGRTGDDLNVGGYDVQMTSLGPSRSWGWESGGQG